MREFTSHSYHSEWRYDTLRSGAECIIDEYGTPAELREIPANFSDRTQFSDRCIAGSESAAQLNAGALDHAVRDVLQRP